MFVVSRTEPTPATFELSSELSADAPSVWQWISSPEGINAELWPLKMHLPDEAELTRLADGEKRGILISLCGIVPIDWHRLGLEQVEVGRGFHERSSSLGNRLWVHVRTLEPHGAGTTLRDRVEFIPRIRWLSFLFRPLYQAVFRRRHRVLRSRFA